MKWIQNQQQQHLVDLEENLSQSESLNQVGLISKKLEPRGNSRLSSEEIERRLTEVIRPKGQLRLRGLHLYDLMKSSAPLPVSIKGYSLSAVTDFPFVVGLAMRLHGDGAKAVGKKLGRSWQLFQNVVRDLGLKPLTTKESRNRPQAIDRWEMLYEEASMISVKEAQKDVTWANHPAAIAWYSMKRYYEKNPERPILLTEDEKLERKKKYEKLRRQDPIFRIKENIRKRLREKLKGSSGTNAVTGCTSQELRQWLESKFKGSMSWDNYGTAWHVDHVRPCASFDVLVKADRLAMNHYTNLQPMWAKTNMKKSDQWDGQQDFAHELF